MKRINKARSSDRQRARYNMYYEQFGLCFWCWQPTTLTYRQGGKAKPYEATIDHITPRALGGGNRRDNLVLACWKCNNLRGKTDASLFAQKLHSQRQRTR